MSLKNEKILQYKFLDEMYQDSYYPKALVQKGEQILRALCLRIETESPKNLQELYVLTEAATEEFNELQREFDEQNSEIETVARGCIGEDFYQIAQIYGFVDADREKLITSRDW